VIEVTRKILVFAVALIIIAMLTTPLAVAKPCLEKSKSNCFDYVLHVEFADALDDYPSVWTWYPTSVMEGLVPPYSQYLALPPEGARVLTVKNRIWYLPNMPFPVARYVAIGTENIPLSPSDFYCLYDVLWLYGPDFGIYTLKTTLTLNSPEYTGTLHITSIEKTGVDVEQNAMIGKGVFAGYGTINGQNVRLSGERNVILDFNFILPPTMEEKGTIHFLGKR
jgi:hypothetical protein